MKRRPPPARSRRAARATPAVVARRVRRGRKTHRPTARGPAAWRGQKDVEDTLAEYAELYDLAPVAYVTLDRAGLVRALNLTALRLLRRSRGHLEGRPFQVLVSPNSRRGFLKDLSRLRRGLRHCSSEIELQPAGGPLVNVQMVIVAHGPKYSPGIEFRAALVDITERKRAEARTAALARLGLLLSAAPEAHTAARALVDTALAFCPWDACFLLLHDPGTDTVTDLVNMDTIKGQRVPVAPMLRGRPPSPLVRKVLAEGPQLILREDESEPGPLTTRFGDTSRLSLSLMFVPVRLEGRSIGVLSLQSYTHHAYGPGDLTTLQWLADHVAGALARLQARDALARVNAQLEARVAERTAELQRYREHLEELVGQRTAELQAANQRLQHEVAYRAEAEARLVRTAEELKRSNLELEQFAYVASHDLQEPLRAVGGFVRLLEHRFPEKVDSKAREYIEGATEGANRMEQLILDLLALSRVSTDARAPSPTSLQKPLESALRNLRFSIRAAGAKVTHDPLPTLAVDESHFVQLFQNLIANALKFRRDAPPEIHIGARAEDGGWVLWVRDNGIGIDTQYFERIFQVFQRLHTRKSYPGTGIGLAICKRIVEQHGGRIWVESQPGQGSTFYLAIPRNAGIIAPGP